jgi:hypothetical protein
MAKDTYYFSHDYNARHDPKTNALKSDYGLEGYGRFWVIIEMLAEQDDYKLKKKGWGIKAIASECQCDTEQIKQFINDCINEFELFEEDEEFFWSKSLNRRMKIKDEKLEQKRKAGKKGAQARWGSNDKGKQKKKDGAANGTAIAKNGKGKDTKGKEKDQVTLVRNLKKFQTDYFKKVLPPNQRPKFDKNSPPYKAAAYLRKLILENNKREPVPNNNPKDLENWSVELDRLNRLGPVGAKNKGYNWKEIGKIMDWCQDDSFWKKNIKSASKFRKQITKLEDNMEDNAGNNNYKSKKEKSNKAVKNLYKKYEQEESKNVQKGNS